MGGRAARLGQRPADATPAGRRAPGGGDGSGGGESAAATGGRAAAAAAALRLPRTPRAVRRATSALARLGGLGSRRAGARGAARRGADRTPQRRQRRRRRWWRGRPRRRRRRRRRAAADAPALLGWSRTAWRSRRRRGRTRFRQGIVVGFGEGEKVASSRRTRSSAGRGYFATFRRHRRAGRLRGRRAGRPRVPREGAGRRVDGGDELAPRGGAAARCRRRRRRRRRARRRRWRRVRGLQALARADARSVFDEARRLGLPEVLQGMPASERKYCAKVPLTELATWVDRLHRNATLRAARTVR